MKLEINSLSVCTNESESYCGLGMISANNSSRLLLDYKYKNPEAYKKILELCFSEKGLAFSHLKIELGSDVNSSSGTEPSTMRYEYEKPDVRRGAGFILASDAKKINPDLTLEFLRWSEPSWVTNSDDVFAARYKWYKETLDSAYYELGLVFDYIGANRNEREVDAEWIKYLSKRLKSEKNAPYDYGKIKLVASDEEGRWATADLMLSDNELLEAVDIIGSHYTDFSTENVKTLCEGYGKKIWFSEGSPPMSYGRGVERFGTDGSALSGINGVIDIVNRIVAMYPCGKMTMYEFQPAVSAYYDGVTYCHKSLITACSPWDGSFRLEDGFFATLHFSRFFKKGWKYIRSACFCDARPGGDGHALVDCHKSCLAMSSPDLKDFSVLIVNPAADEMKVELKLDGFEAKSLSCFETDGKRLFSKRPDISVCGARATLCLEPFSIICLSTLDIEEFSCYHSSCSKNLPLPFSPLLPFSENELKERGGAPYLTTDEGGAFEIEKDNGKNIIVQKITDELRAEEWGFTPEPVSCFGDDRWFNYTVEAEVEIPDEKNAYAGAGLRYNLADSGQSGVYALLYSDGSWKLFYNKKELSGGIIGNFSVSSPHKISVTAKNEQITLFIDSELIKEENLLCASGRAAIFSSYHNSRFLSVEVSSDENEPYIERIDDTDDAFSYKGDSEHTTMGSFKLYKRTCSVLKTGAELALEFNGTGFILTGETKPCRIILKTDNKEEREINISAKAHREASLAVFGLEKALHSVVILVKEGELTVDSAEITT